MKKIVWLALFLVCMGHFAEAQGWARSYTFADGTFKSLSTIITKNDSFITAGYFQPTGTSTSYVLIQKCDPNGIPVWQKHLTTLTASSDTITLTRANDNGYIMALSGFFNLPRTRAAKVDELGNLVWQKSYYLRGSTNYGRIIPNKSKTGYAILSSGSSVRITNAGDSVRSDSISTMFFRNWAVSSKTNKDFVTFQRLTNFTGELREIQSDNSFSTTVTPLAFPDSLGDQVVRLADGNYLIHGLTYSTYVNGNQESLWSHAKYTPDGQLIWKKHLKVLNVSSWQVFASPASDGGFIETIRQNTLNRLIRYDKNGNIVWDRTLSLTGFGQSHSIVQTSDGGFIIGMNNTHARINSDGDIYSPLIFGRVREDSNNDCIAQSNEKPFRGLMMVEAKKAGASFFAAVDSVGNYRLNLDTGRYTLTLSGIWSSLWQICTPSVSKDILVPSTTDSIHFSVNPLVNCPAMRVNAGTWGLRRCFENTYSVNYFNDGTTVARNAYVEITIDSLMEFRRASRPLSSRVGQRLRFNVGDVDYGRGGNFNVTVYVKCGDSTRLNQTLCFETHVFPDTICTPTTGWNGANIVVTGTCARDSVEFTIRNTGNAATGTVRSLIVEDQVMFAVQPISLPPNGVLIKKQPANGSTWRLSVQQVANNPRSTFATAFVEGCRNNPTAPFSTGNATAFPDADGDAAVDIQCLAIRGAYDPNDKTGYPLGTGTSRQIGQNQDIEYLIRFQNTGTDTAFQVVLRDTLPSQLDLTSIEPGASSHPYTWDLTGKGVLIFNFDNIRLMDSFRNEPASHGFVKFRIKQKKDLPIGTKIENSAGIYFDFNAPVITNRTLHTIGKDVLLTATVERIFDERVKIEVFPNPFSDFLTFNIKQATPSVNEGLFELFDLTGKVLRREKFVDNQFTFERKDLPMGLFIFKISTVDGRLIGQGKVVAK